MSGGRRMKAKYFCLTALLLLTGCSLLWGPTATVRKFMTSAQKGDVDTMTRMFSSKATQKLGADTIRSNNQSFANTAKGATASNGSYRMENIQETATADGKRVSFFYKSAKGTDSIRLIFDLSKEGGEWKIDDIGGPEPQETKTDVPSTSVPMLPEEQPPPPPTPSSDKGETDTKSSTSKTISGGVLNGKAISLPKPAYPPVARAVKASGTVVVQVIVDENGNVITAHAVSGHPLLQAAAVAAARAAKFTPTKLNDQPAKVTGVINYDFSPE
jgi:protein TonB